jgi:endo-1,4-beta-xylanase
MLRFHLAVSKAIFLIPLVVLAMDCASASAQTSPRPQGDYPATEPDHPTSISLWANGAPGSEARKNEKEKVLYHVGANYSYTQVSNIHDPSVTPYLPAKDKATGAAVIIAPGGGHQFLALDHEGYLVGQWLADHGIAGFVLKYRLARQLPSANYTVAGESLSDMQRAIRLIRSRAAEWNIKPDAVGVMGFSAGGEIAGLASMKYDDGNADAADPIDRMNCKPSFQVLMYPGNSKSVIPDKNSPPAFLACAADDRPDISEGVANIYLLMHKAGVPVEMHIYGSGGHGFGLGIYKPNMLEAAWPMQFVDWLGSRGFLGAVKP